MISATSVRRRDGRSPAVGTIVGLVSLGHGFSGILTAYPYLEAGDVRALA